MRLHLLVIMEILKMYETLIRPIILTIFKMQSKVKSTTKEMNAKHFHKNIFNICICLLVFDNMAKSEVSMNQAYPVS